MANWEYKYTIEGHFEKDGKTVYIHPENIDNFIGVYRYTTKLFPTYLIRLEIDQNLFDFIINNSELLIHITVTKMEMSNKDVTKHSAPEVVIDSDMAVITSSDLDYNHELNYATSKISGKLDEDKYRSTYIGLVPSECLDANKCIENINIINSSFQDIVLNYMERKGIHLLIEPFHHSEYAEQLIVPPLDTTYSFIEYLDNMSSFYNTKFLLFFEEPRITYLLSKNGNAVQSKLDQWPDVVINIRSATDPNNVKLGVTLDGWTQATIVDCLANASTFTQDNTSPKLFDNIAAILNPSLDNAKNMEDAFKNIKDAFKKSMDSFIQDVTKRSNEAIGQATKIFTSIHKMEYAVNEIQRVTKDLNTVLNPQTMTAIDNIPASITKIDPETGLPSVIPIMDDEAKSLLKTVMSNNFITCQDNKNQQVQVRGCFGQVMSDTANQYYKTDFLDNNVRAVTYVNLQDVSKLVDNAIKSLNSGTAAAIGNMASQITPLMGSFPGLPNTLGNMKNTIDDIITFLQGFQKPEGDESGGSGDGEASGEGEEGPDPVADSIAELTTISGCFGDLGQKTDYYGGFGTAAQKTGSAAQDMLQGFSDYFQKGIGMFNIATQIDLKRKLVSTEAPRIFGAKSLNTFMSNGINDSLSKFIGGAAKTLSSNITKITAVTNAMQGGLPGLTKDFLGNCTGGLVKVADLKNLSKSIEKFDLSGISKLGLNNISFDLNLGADKNKKTVGTKLLKVRNDNPNQLKNIKSEIEMNKNELTLHKSGLPFDAFGPNKKYHINNYIGYNQCDGRFLLKEKVIILAKEDKLFSCETKLTFAKIIPEAETNNETSKATSTSQANPQEANKK